MQLYFIRHAQSTNNWLLCSTGSTVGRSEDPELTPIGWQQIKYLAGFLGRGNPNWSADHSGRLGFGITHLYTSLMVRAIRTGMAVAHALGLPLVAWEDLHETGGIYLDDPATGKRVGQPGKTRAEFEKLFPELVLPDSLGQTGWWNRPFEEREQRPARAQRFFYELLRRHGNTDDRVAVISHGGFYNYFLREVFKIEREDCWFDLANVAITRIDFTDTIVLVYMNRADFVPETLVT